VSTVTYLVLIAAATLFAVRMIAGPSLADRVVGLNGALLVGMVAIAAHATFSGVGAFVPVLVVIALVGFVSTAIIARFIEGRGR
jgi:multisubunit Na+/H+ antiporter MnhF subunit